MKHSKEIISTGSAARGFAPGYELGMRQSHFSGSYSRHLWRRCNGDSPPTAHCSLFAVQITGARSLFDTVGNYR